MSSDSSNHNLLDEVADEIVSRRHAGETPSLSEYCRKYPQLGEQLRELFPTLMLLEDAKLRSAAMDFEPAVATIGDYVVVREIGRGGMGIVYEAQQKSLHRRVALKILSHRWSNDDGALARFQREARAAAQMHHTNIVPVFEVGEEEGRFFYAMQLIDGTSLEQWIIDRQGTRQDMRAKRPRDVASASGDDRRAQLAKDAAQVDTASSGTLRLRHYRTVAEIGLQAAEALAYAHARGIIHRDIKPSNLLLDEQGSLWVTDFGLAKSDSDTLTREGDFVGTLRYMSPERFRGECDERADVYGLGLTLYEMLALQPAFQSFDRLKLIDLISRSEPARLASIDPHVPRDLETIVLKSIDKEPASRYTSAAALADDLQRYLNDQPTRARRHSLIELLIRWGRRNKGLAAALSSLAALLLVMVTGLALFSIRETALRRRAEVAQHVAEARGEELQQTLYFSEMNLASQASSDWYGAGTIRSRVDFWNTQGMERDLRGWEWYYLYSLSHRDRFSSKPLAGATWSVDWSADGERLIHVVDSFGWQMRDAQTGRVLLEKRVGPLRCTEWSPNGERFATGDFKGHVVVWDSATGQELVAIDLGARLEVFATNWSPDGTLLATCRRQTDDDDFFARIWNTSTGELVQTLRGHTGNVKELLWSRDGARVASASSDGSVGVWDVASGKELARFHSGSEVFTVCWSPDNTKLVSAGLDDTIRVWDLLSGTETATMQVKAGSSFVAKVRWRPGAQQLAAAHGDGVIRIWDLETEQVARELYGHVNQVHSVVWNPEGTQVASGGTDRTIRTWVVEVADQTQLLRATAGHVTCVDWTADGTRIASCTQYIGPALNTWRTSDGQSLLARQFEWDLHSVAWSPNDQKLAFGGQSDKVLIWDARRQELQQRQGNIGWVRELAWSRDGRLAALSVTGDVFLWDQQGNLVASYERVHQGWASSLDWHPDGQRVATTATDNVVKVWDVTTGKVHWQASNDLLTIRKARWSTDGALLATSHDGAVILWDGSTGRELKRLDEVRENFRSLDWHPDGSRIATGSAASVSVWDVKSGHVAIKVPTNRSPVLCVRWSPGGKRLAAGCEDGVHIWDATPGYLTDQRSSASDASASD